MISIYIITKNTNIVKILMFSSSNMFWPYNYYWQGPRICQEIWGFNYGNVLSAWQGKNYEYEQPRCYYWREACSIGGEIMFDCRLDDIQWTENMALPVLMGSHSRLGRGSPIFLLDPLILKRILPPRPYDC